MESLVKFIVIGKRTDFQINEDYLNLVMDKLKNKGLVYKYLTNRSKRSVELYEDFCYNSEFVINRGDKQPSTNWRINFQFGTFGTTEQLQVNIISDNYKLDHNNSLLEDLKIELKNILSSNWEKIVWLQDKDSELLSAKLYPLIYKTENMTRQFINEVMIKSFGINWWDSFVPLTIRNKHKRRFLSYKDITKNFKNIDEKLMLIDTGDLSKIFFLKPKKWNPQYNELIEDYINGRMDFSKDKLYEILLTQSENICDLWEDVFSKYLSSKFKENYRIFELNRNHVMHNKLIDRSAYKAIKSSIKIVEKDLLEAISKAEDSIISRERVEELSNLSVENDEKLKKELELIYQEEAGVNVRSKENIEEYFKDLLINFCEYFTDVLRFREYLSVEKTRIRDNIEENRKAFSLIRNFDQKYLDIFVKQFNIDEDKGATSTLVLSFSDDKDNDYIIEYVNGDYDYNQEQGNFMPITSDYDDLNQEKLAEFLMKKIDEELPDPMDLVESENFIRVKDGGVPVLLEGHCCEACCEETVYIGTELADYGQCLKCGESNNVNECERCGLLFIGKSVPEYIPNLCDNCIEYYENE
ncbi:hypothetical protein [Enterococcus sp. AZ007]|uniref:hypothetical protein n=1 Tax=Enterococcus sp. AZ007 TaxID=2774839 RepID=UPI003F26AC7B